MGEPVATRVVAIGDIPRVVTQYRSFVATCDIQSAMVSGLIGQDAGAGTELDGGKRAGIAYVQPHDRPRRCFKPCRRNRTSDEITVAAAYNPGTESEI